MPIIVTKGATFRFLDENEEEIDRAVLGGDDRIVVLPPGTAKIELLGVWEMQTGRHD